MRQKIGECLIQSGTLTLEDLQHALAEHARTGERVGVVLIRLHLATDRQVARALATQLGFPYVDLSENPPDPAAMVLIPKDLSLDRLCIAIGLEANLLTVAMSDPMAFSLVQDLELRTGYRIKQVVAPAADITDAIQAGYPDDAFAWTSRPVSSPRGAAPDATHQVDSEAATTIDLANQILGDAITSHASDIHIERFENGVRVRHRLDGVLKDVMHLPASVHQSLIAHLKMIGRLEATETRLPQDGRLRANHDDGAEVDFRVLSLRTVYGEKVVLRVLNQPKAPPALEEIGMSRSAREEMRHFLAHHRGMVLVAGPAGSGRTTTLGATLAAATSENTNSVTIEDPIEYLVPGANQTQVNREIDLTFARALRSIVQQDPDVIVIGDLRDAETAEIAVQAAQKSLVFAALLADDAPSCIARLTDLGVEPFTLSSALVGVVAQRIVRRLCVNCRRQQAPRPEMVRALGVLETEANVNLYQAVGCVQCNHTGYRGRIGIFEVMRVTDRLRRAIASRGPAERIRVAADNLVSLDEDGLAKVKSGITTAEELLRVLTRIRGTRRLCPGCGAAVGRDFVGCPQCGQRLGSGCPHCGRALQPEWQFCPYCARSAEADTRGPEGVRDKAVRDRRPPGNVAERKN